MTVQGIQADELKRKIEGAVDDPFTRRKTKPKLSTGGANKVRVKVRVCVKVIIKVRVKVKDKVRVKVRVCFR